MNWYPLDGNSVSANYIDMIMTRKTDLGYTGGLLFWTKQELSSVCDWYKTIFLPDCNLELITPEFFRRFQNWICLWLYFLSGHLSFFLWWIYSMHQYVLHFVAVFQVYVGKRLHPHQYFIYLCYKGSGH